MATQYQQGTLDALDAACTAWTAYLDAQRDADDAERAAVNLHGSWKWQASRNRPGADTAWALYQDAQRTADAAHKHAKALRATYDAASAKATELKARDGAR